MDQAQIPPRVSKIHHLQGGRVSGEAINEAALPHGSVVWPADGRPSRRPIWREEGVWTDGQTRFRMLEKCALYDVLRVAQRFTEGDVVTHREELGELPVGTVLIDRVGCAAQSWTEGDHESDDSDRTYWSVTAYSERTAAWEVLRMMEEPVTILRLPRELAEVTG